MAINRLVIVGCGAAKQDDRSKAKDLYTSTYFRKKREYAETVGDAWLILSAQHGLLHPNQEVDPYDTTIGDLTDSQLDELAHSVGMTLIDYIATLFGRSSEQNQIIVLAGRSYINPLKEREAFSAGIGETFVYPLQQNNLGGIGEQMAWLGDRIDAHACEQTQLPIEASGGMEQ